MKISVLMSVFNSEEYLQTAIDSILSQNFNNFEFIIVNDGSTDNTAKILASYNDPRIRIINNELNIGLTKSLIRGLKIATGQYIARMDADDISLPTRLEKQIDVLENNLNIGLLGTSWFSIDTCGQKLNLSRVYSGPESVHFMCHGSVMIRKDYFDSVGGYRSIFKYAQDYDLWLRLREVSNVVNIVEPLYMLRVHSKSVSTTKSYEQDLYAALAIELADERKKCGRDRLWNATQEETLEIQDQQLNQEMSKQRKALTHLYATWGQAAFRLGEYRRAYRYVKQAVQAYP